MFPQPLSADGLWPGLAGGRSPTAVMDLRRLAALAAQPVTSARSSGEQRRRLRAAVAARRLVVVAGSPRATGPVSQRFQPPTGSGSTTNKAAWKDYDEVHTEDPVVFSVSAETEDDLRVELVGLVDDPVQVEISSTTGSPPA